MDIKDFLALGGFILGVIGVLGSVFSFMHGKSTRDAANTATQVMERGMNQLRKDLEAERTQRDEQKRQYEAEKATLASKLEDITTEAERAKKAEDKTRADYEALNAAHKASVRQAEDLIRQIEAKGYELSQMRTRMEEIQREHAEYRESAQKDRQQLRESYDALEAKYDALEKSRTSLEEQIKKQGLLHDEELKKLNEATKRQIAEVNQRYEALNAELERTKKAMNDTQGKLDNARQFLKQIGVPDTDIDRVFSAQVTLDEIRWAVLKRLIEGVPADEILAKVTPPKEGTTDGS